MDKLREVFKKIQPGTGILLLALLGVVFLTLPDGKENKSSEIEPPGFSLEEQEKKIGDALRNIEGVGEVAVTLSLRGGVERDFSESADSSYYSTGGGRKVERRYLYPEYLGAVVICEGGDRDRVRLEVTRAVSSLTGLGSDRITVLKMRN
jgi:stage III sporulation protein AG